MSKTINPAGQHWHRRTAGLCVVIATVLGAAFSPAAVWTYTNRTSTSWTTAANWNPNTVPPIGATNYPGRINVNATLVYDFATNTGFGTIVNATPEFGRAMVIGNGSGATGTVEIVSGKIVAFQAILQEAVIVGAPGGGGTSKGYLNLNGGDLMIVATNYGVLSCPYRGGPNALGVVTVGNGSTLTVDRFRFGGQTVGAADIGAGCSGNLFLNSGGTVAVRNIANQGNPANMRATNFFNGGTLKVSGPEEGRWPLINTNVENNVMAGGLVIDTAGQNARIVSPIMNGTGGMDGGLTKKGNGTLNLYGAGSTYTGPTVVQAGTLGVQVPMTSTDFVVVPGAALNLITDNLMPWAIPALALTNASLGFDYGNYSSYMSAVASVTSLRLEGNVMVNLIGTSFPATDLTLLTYGSKTGSGSFKLGSLPSGAVATLEDTGSALILHITSPSLQALTWTAGSGSTWQVGGAANWNYGTATYLEYSSGVGDIVKFDDSSSGTVNLSGSVKPTSINVNVVGSIYTFSGTGSIGGPTGLFKEGGSTLQLSTANSYTGVTTVDGGTLIVDNAGALGATNGGTVVENNATLQVGAYLGSAVTVPEETAYITGPGLGGSLGALRGGQPSAGTNVWAGPVVIMASNARIGTENSGNLVVSGQIKGLVENFALILRPAQSGVLSIANPNNAWGGDTLIFGEVSGKVVLGADNAFSTTGALLIGDATLDLAGRSQLVAGLGGNGGTADYAIIRNDGASLSTLTLDPASNRSFPGIIQNGASPISIVKNGTNTQTFTSIQNTYTGPTIVNGGTLAVTLPMSSSSVTLADSTTLTLNVSNSTWTATALKTTNATINVNFGALAAAPTVPLTAGNLSLSGSNVINVTGANIPSGTVTLISYTSKSGTGAFYLGTMPVGMQATLVDTGSAIALNVTFSPQTLSWFGLTTGTWNKSSSLDWNMGTAFYKEYANGLGDFALFDDTALMGTVNVSVDVRPFSMTINNTAAMPFSFNGPGRISGPANVTKQGSGPATFNGENTYTGATTISGGSITVTTNNALGDLNTNVVVGAPGSLGLAGGITYPAKSIIITGTGVSNANHFFEGSAVQRGALQSVSGDNTWLGNVTFTVNDTRIGVQDGARLTLAGNITESTNGLRLIFRHGNTPGSEVIISGSGNYWTGGTDLFGGGGGVKLGRNEALPAVSHLRVGTTGIPGNSYFDLNGFSQTAAGLSQVNGNLGIILNNGASPSKLTLNTLINHTYFGTIQNGTSAISVDLGGPAVQTLAGTNTYTGVTTVIGGGLRVTGELLNSPVSVNGGSLDGSGLIGGPVSVNAAGTIQPGVSAALNEVLTITNTVVLAGTAVFQIGKSDVTPVSDTLAGVTDITYGGKLIVTNATGAALAVGDVFNLVAATGAKTGNFTSVQVLPSSLGLSGTFDPATGQLTLSAAPVTPTLGYVKTETGLQFSWTGSARLQAQTNSVSIGIGSNWADYPGGATSPVTVPFDTANGTVFFRLISP